MTNQTLGHYVQDPEERCEYLSLVFSPLSAPLRSRWRNNGLSADFLGDYVTTFLPANGAAEANGACPKEIRHAVTYIANELLENAMKYHERSVDLPIEIHLGLTSRTITVTATNGAGIGQAECYREFIETILREDPGELFIKSLERTSENKESTASCMGLLTMINDYHALLGWRFAVDPRCSNAVMVSTRVALPFQSLLGAITS